MVDKLRQDIVAVAMSKMRQVGIRSVSIDDVCHELGISKKTFYVYFATKDELVEATLKQLEREVNEHILEQLEKKTILELLLNIQKIMRETRDVRKVPPLFYDLEKYYPQLYAAHRERSRTHARGNIKVALQLGKEEHLFRDDLDVDKTCVVIDMMHEIILNLPVEQRESKKNMEIMKYATDLIMRGIISEEGKKMVKENQEQGTRNKDKLVEP